MNRYLFVFSFISLFLVSCSSTPERFSSAGPRKLLFPLGVYFHDVTIKSPDGKEHSMKGVVKLSAGKTHFVGLSPIQTTMFKLEDDLKTGKIQLEVFEPRLQKIKPQILSFYQGIRDLLRYQVAEVDEQPGTFTTSEYQIDLTEFDSHLIPRLMTVKKGDLVVSVKVAGYEVGSAKK